MISSILVPTDGSETAQKAARYAIDLAKQLNCAILIVSVVDIRMFIAEAMPAQDSPPYSIVPIEEYLGEAAERHANEIKELCDQTGVRSKIAILSGYPAEEITREAEHSAVDLIVVGSHGRSAIAAAFLGSVAYSIIHKETKIPVLVVRK